MYIGEYNIGEFVLLDVTTHSFASGVITTASSISYQVFENEATTAMIASTNMTLFATASGAYLDAIAIVTASGYEVGKRYSALIEALVAGVYARDWRTFRVVATALVVGSNPAVSFSAITISGTSTFTGAVVLSAGMSGDIKGTLSTLTTYTGNTPQTGDVYALANGSAGFVAIKADLTALLVTASAISAKIDTLDTTCDLIEDILRNKMIIVDSSGQTTLYADNNVDVLYQVAAGVTDDSTETTRKRLE